MLSSPKYRATSSYRSEYAAGRSRLASTRTCKRIGEDFGYYPCDLIGTGMSSRVYKGTHLRTKQPVSVKVISKSVLKDNRLGLLVKNQIRLLAKVDHPNVLRLESVVETDEDVCIVTEYCGEGDLEARIKKLTKLDEATATAILKDIISGYQHISERDIIHRDLKPANVFLCGGKAKIADFGFAITPKDTEAKKLNVGSPLYMPVEALEDATYSSKSDIFALGVMYYEMLHGKTPWAARTERELLSRMKKESAVIDACLGLSETAKTFLRKSLAVTADKRMCLKELLSFFDEPTEEGKSRELKESCVTKDTSKDTQHSVDRHQRSMTGMNPHLLAQYSSAQGPRARLNSYNEEITCNLEFKTESTRQSYRKYPPRSKKVSELIEPNMTKPSAKSRPMSVLYQKHNMTTFDKVKSSQKGVSKNPRLMAEVAELLDSLMGRFSGEAFKFLPNLLLGKMTYTLAYYKKVLVGSPTQLKIPEDLVEDGEVQIMSRCTDPVLLCQTYEPFLRRMIRLINHYSKQVRDDLDLLSKLLTLYRHLIEAGKYLDYWSRTSLRQENVRNLEEFREGFFQLVN